MKKNIEEAIDRLEYVNRAYDYNNYYSRYDLDCIEILLSDYKRVLKENEIYKKQYFGLIDKIENKIDKFDYEFEKAKRENYRERADYYWDLIINLKKLLESEE